MAVQVSDSASNRNEQIENASTAIGRSLHRRSVFEAIHHGKKELKTVSDLVSSTGLTQKQVLMAAKPLVKKRVIEQTRVKGETAYCKNHFLQAHKNQVLALAGNPQRSDDYPTKRNRRSTVVVKEVMVPVSLAEVEEITIDDIATFRKVRGTTSSECLPGVSELVFKKGIQAILFEPGKFSDWGGERNDLLSSRLILAGKRLTVAFAFKGPGTKGRLTPKKLGKNGDQIQRLLQSTADVYLIQYWREIDESVRDQLRPLAMAKSVMDKRKVWYGLIDGFDSRRIYDAYRDVFPA